MKKIIISLGCLLISTTIFAKKDKGDTCDRVKLNQIFVNESSTNNLFGVIIGLNNTKKEKETPLEALLASNEVSATSTITIKDQNDKTITTTVKPTKDKAGNWTFEDSHKLDNDKTVYSISAISFRFISVCGDTQTFEASYRKRAKHMRTWEKILVSETEDVILQGTIVPRKINGVEFGNSSSTISINEGNLEIVNNSTFNMNFKVSPETTSKDEVSIILTVKDCKGNPKTYSSAAKYNEKTKFYEVSTSFDANKECVWTVVSFAITVINEDKDSTFFETNGKLATTMDGKTEVMIVKKTGKGKYVSKCNTAFTLNDVNFAETTTSNIYAFNFYFKYENTNKEDKPLTTLMLVELTDCNNKTIHVKVAIKYNEKTGLYVGSESITNAKNCNYAITNIAIAAITTCEDIEIWEATPKKSKTVVNAKKQKNVESFNVLLHELRGLALEVTLD